jgi:Fuc2NAc and GlcNAc transferase
MSAGSAATLGGLALAALALAWAITGLVRRYALARSVVDVPNHRSSHSEPTPRGGGLAIAIATLAGGGALAALGVVPRALALAFIGGGALIAAIGWLDDHRPVRAGVRLVVHLVAAVWAVGWIGAPRAIDLGVGSIPLGPFGALVGVLGIVWFTNLFNFMDGIDGLAGGEAVVVGLAAGALLLIRGATGPAGLALLIAGASAGFLVWNWAPARIFMGDVGSGLLGYLFAVLAIASDGAGAVPLLVWVLLCGAFVFDATVTLARRALRGERLQDAHRSHAYQRVLAVGWGHARVSGSVLILDAVLALLAFTAVREPRLLLLCFAGAVATLTALYLRIERASPPAPRSLAIRD